MTDSYKRTLAESTLDRIDSLLDEGHMQESIDRRLDSAAVTFLMPGIDSTIPSNRGFLDLIAKFARHVHLCGLPISRNLTATQARAEAVSILERTYQGQGGRGYEAALVDTLSLGESGADYILSYVTNALKVEERRKHIRWVLATNIDSLSWESKRDIVCVILCRLKDLLPDEVRTCRPERLADFCARLILDNIETANELKHAVLGHSRRQ